MMVQTNACFVIKGLNLIAQIIVKLFGNQDDKQHLDEYEQKFNEYIKRRVFPITIDTGSQDFAYIGKKRA